MTKTSMGMERLGADGKRHGQAVRSDILKRISSGAGEKCRFLGCTGSFATRMIQLGRMTCWHGLSGRQRWFQLSGLESFIAMVDLVPINYVPPGRKVLRPAVVVLQVIRVLPHIVAENWEQSLRDRVVLVRCAEDLNLAAWFSCEPDPSTAKLFGADVIEFGLEIVEITEALLDHISDRPIWISATFGFHDLPEHGVVDMAAAVVADGNTNIFEHD